MPGGEPAPRARRAGRGAGGRLLRRGGTALVAGILALAAAAGHFDLGPRWFGWDYPSPVDEPAQVAPPPGLEVPSPLAAPAVAPETHGGGADPAEVRRAVRSLVTDPRLGRRVAVTVQQLADGRTVYDRGVNRVIPASTMKLLTGLAALEALGGGHRFSTTVMPGRVSGEVVLVGGGDPFLARKPPTGDVYPMRADLETLAAGTAKALAATGRDRVRLRYDAGLFTGPATNPRWRASYVTEDVVSPVSALWVDAGREAGVGVSRSADPAAAAAEAFAAALEAEGVRVRGRPRPGTAPAGDPLAEVRGAPLDQVVQRILEVSDNEGSEVLFRHVALAEGRPGSFAGGSAAVRAVLGRLGIDMAGQRMYDGSGLSRHNRLSPDLLLEVLQVAASEDHPGLRPVVADLPVAGFTGSLSYRFTSGSHAGLGTVRAKTGTLTGVHALAGVVTDRDGTELAFVAAADRVKVQDTLAARSLLDRIAAALAGCSCGIGSAHE